jgi:hypothetical protein
MNQIFSKKFNDTTYMFKLEIKVRTLIKLEEIRVISFVRTKLVPLISKLMSTITCIREVEVKL